MPGNETIDLRPSRLELATEVHDLRARVEELEALLAHERRLVQVTAEGNMFQRFHAFDAIKNDACPACGGRVRVIEDHNSVRLEAVPR